jgi:hypothetical protein
MPVKIIDIKEPEKNGKGKEKIIDTLEGFGVFWSFTWIGHFEGLSTR